MLEYYPIYLNITLSYYRQIRNHYLTNKWREKTLRDRGIRRGIEVFVRDSINPDMPTRKALVVNTYPHPSRWLVVQYEDGNMEQVEENQVTTMFEMNRKGIEI